MILSLLALCVSVSAQTESERFEQKYDLLVSRLGPAGVGVQVVLDNWQKVDSTNAKMLFGRFSYFFTKAQEPQVVTKPAKKYLGMSLMMNSTARRLSRQTRPSVSGLTDWTSVL